MNINRLFYHVKCPNDFQTTMKKQQLLATFESLLQGFFPTGMIMVLDGY